MAIICSNAPWWRNDWGDPVSRRARQGNWDVAEAPLVKDGKVVNVAPSIVTTPLVKSGPCFDIKGSSVRVRLSRGPQVHGRRVPDPLRPGV